MNDLEPAPATLDSTDSGLLGDSRVRVVAFLLALAVIFAGAWWLGAVATKADLGLTFSLGAARAEPGKQVPITFTIDDADGQPATRFAVRHGKPLHLIAVREDLTGFQHVHPAMAADGTWSTTLDLTPGPWRLYADFQLVGYPARVLVHGLDVVGDYRPVAGSGPSRVWRGDGFRVATTGTLTGSASSMLTFTLTRAGRPVTDLQPYLGAFGHLVILRDADLGYLHVHPQTDPGAAIRGGPKLAFHVEVPGPGRYHLFLNFQRHGVVRTAEFVLDATGSADSTGMSHAHH